MRLNVALLALCCAACFTVNQVNIGQKTSLEKQLMGDITPLSEEETLVSSVRAGPAALQTVGLTAQDVAVRARERQLFNRDDIRTLKTQGCLGEDAQAMVKARPCPQDKDAATLALRDRLIAEENADRRTLIAWACGLSALQNKPDDTHDITAAYRRLLLESAQPGDVVQTDEGTWVAR